jgi:hypothetical protein
LSTKAGWSSWTSPASKRSVSGSYVADNLRDRESDVIWRARWGRDWLYVYLLLEFQSTVDPFMAVRVMVYLGLLYQDLIRSQNMKSDGRLPPVLPIVLYNGKAPWTAAEHVGDLIAPGPAGLERYRPDLIYLLLDEGRYPESELAPLRNLAAAVFRVENSTDPEALARVLDALLAWIGAPEQASLRDAFVVWLNRVVLRGKLPGVEFPQLNDLQEIRTMLAERATDWTQTWKQQGRQEGLAEGIQKGLVEGVQKGEAALLLRQLEVRFGPLSEADRARLMEADADRGGAGNLNRPISG